MSKFKILLLAGLTCLGFGNIAQAQTVYAVSGETGNIYEIPPGHIGPDAPLPIGQIEQDFNQYWNVIENTQDDGQTNIDLTYQSGALYGLVSGDRDNNTDSLSDGSKIFRVNTNGSFDTTYGNYGVGGSGFYVLKENSTTVANRVAEGISTDGINLIVGHYNSGGTAISNKISQVDPNSGIILNSESTRFPVSLPDIDVPDTNNLRDIDGLGRCNANYMVVNSDGPSQKSYIDDLGSLPNIKFDNVRNFNDPAIRTYDIAFTGSNSFVVAGRMPHGPGGINETQLHYFQIVLGNPVHQKTIRLPLGDRQAVMGVASDNEAECDIDVISTTTVDFTPHDVHTPIGTVPTSIKTEITCCPPSNKSGIIIEQFWEEQTSSAIQSPTKLKYTPTQSFNQQMQWTINLINADHPNAKKLVMAYRLYDVTDPSNETLVGSPMYVIWEPDPANILGTPSAIGAGGSFFDELLLNNREYKVTTITALEDQNGAIRLLDFSEDCKHNGFLYGDTSSRLSRRGQKGAKQRGFKTLTGKTVRKNTVPAPPTKRSKFFRR